MVKKIEWFKYKKLRARCALRVLIFFARVWEEAMLARAFAPCPANPGVSAWARIPDLLDWGPAQRQNEDFLSYFIIDSFSCFIQYWVSYLILYCMPIWRMEEWMDGRLFMHIVLNCSTFWYACDLLIMINLLVRLNLAYNKHNFEGSFLSSSYLYRQITHEFCNHQKGRDCWPRVQSPFFIFMIPKHM